MASKKALKNRLVAKVVDGESGPCAFCRQTNNDEIAFGKLYSIGDLYCHYFCVLLSCCLIQKGQDEHGLLGFLYTDIQAELERSKKHKCSYCGQEGATLGCAVSQCRKQFHLPCGRQKQAVSLFHGNYKSFCAKHAPRQKINSAILEKIKLRMQRASRNATMRAVMGIIGDGELGPTEDEEADLCAICYEPVLGGPSPQSFWPPCCARDARFHRHCLERMALSAGVHYLKCPLCNDKENFYRAVIAQGYYVPDRDAAWELEQNAFADIYDRDINCGAEVCKCPMGRAHDTESGPWDIKLCLLCGSCGVHLECLPDDTSRYVCPACLPAAPEDLAELETKIAQIQEEQTNACASQLRRRRIMPSRMSLRSSKGVVSTSKNWRSQAAAEVATLNSTMDEDKEEDQSNTITSRSQLNLKTPRRDPRPTRHVTEANPLDVEESPLKLLNRRLKDAHAQADVYKMADSLRAKLKRPRPLSHKRRIVNAFFNEIVKEGLKVRSPLREWNSPRRLSITPKKKEQLPAEMNSKLESPKLTKIKTSTPKKDIVKSPRKETAVKSPVEQTGNGPHIIDPADDHDESSNSTFQLPSEFVAEHNSDDELPVFDTPKKCTIVETERNSSDDLPAFETPKKCTTVEMEKDSSMEISNEEAKINIDLIRIESEEESSKVLKNVYVKSPERTAKCSYKFSPTDKEVLQKTDVGIDVESFKSQYLNEVVKDSKPCSYSHKHDSNDAVGSRLMTSIDFALEAVKLKVLEIKESNENNVQEIEREKFLKNSAEVESKRKFETKTGNGMKGTTKTEKRKRRRKRNAKRKASQKGMQMDANEGTDVKGAKKRDRRENIAKKRDKKGMKRIKKHKSGGRKEREGKSENGRDEIIVLGRATGLKRKIDNDEEVGGKKPKLAVDFALEAIKRKILEAKEKQFGPNVNFDDSDELKYKNRDTDDRIVNTKISDHSGDDCEQKKKLYKQIKRKEEKRLKKLKTKQKKENYLLKCKKSKGSVKIKLVYNPNDATDENCIDLTVKSKKKKKSKHSRSQSNNKEINFKIQFKSEQRKRKMSTVSPSALKQTLLNFSPESVSSKNCLIQSKQELTPMKKRINPKKELSSDSLKQTSIQSFFSKIKTSVKEEQIES